MMIDDSDARSLSKIEDSIFNELEGYSENIAKLRRKHEEAWAKLSPEERQAKEQDLVAFCNKLRPAAIEAVKKAKERRERGK